MAILDSIKDPNTGKIKTPILISMVGAGGLLAYLVLSKGSGGGTTTSTGQSSALTPDLTSLQSALNDLLANQGSGNAGTGGGVVPPTTDPTPLGKTWNRLVDPPPPGSTTFTIPDYAAGYKVTEPQPGEWGGITPPAPPLSPPAKITIFTVPNYNAPHVPGINDAYYISQPSSRQVSGSSGSAGGGGSGTGAVIHPITKDPTVYGGLPAGSR